MRRAVALQTLAIVVGTLALISWSNTGRAAHALAAKAQRPSAVWTIGTTDNRGDEFTRGTTRSLVYAVAKGAKPADWRERQDAPDQKYTITFDLPQAPESAFTLAIEGFFIEAGPRALLLTVNGKRGSFRLVPGPVNDYDMRQGGQLTHTRVSLRIPLDASFLRPGANEMSIALSGEGGGSLYYDSLALEPAGDPSAQPQVLVEPTIFFKNVGAQLKEVTDVVVRHQQPLRDASVSLKLGGAAGAAPAAISAKVGDDGFDFGESVVELNVPAISSPRPYELVLKTGGGEKVLRGEYRPEKRWKLFAGLKIHSDIGYTDFQPNVAELNNRNTDHAIDLMSKYPFYKFNLEVSSLADDYINARTPSRISQLTSLASQDRLGIDGLYLNLLTGLCSGEEMYRALYYAKSLERKFKFPVRSASLTDTPSQSWSLPSFLADSGITGFTLASNQHRGPLLINSTLNEDSPFYWEGPDGRRVMAFFARSYSHMDRIAGTNFSVPKMGRAISQVLTRYRRDGYAPDAMYLFGQSSDNSDLRDTTAEAISAWNETYAFPKIIAATDNDYFDYISKNFGSKLPVVRGDGGSYWHDAAGTSTAYTILNRDSQRLLPAAETISAWASLFEPSMLYPADALHTAWKEVLYYDEHTWGAHNSITQPDRSFVTDQFEFKRAHAVRGHWAASDLLMAAMNRLVQHVTIERRVLFVFNPDSRSRNDVVEAEVDSTQALVDLATGQTVPAEVIAEKQGWRRIRFIAENVPAVGYKTYEVRRASEPAQAAEASQNSWEIESRYYRLTLDPKSGAVTHLLDKEAGRDLVDPSAPFRLNELVYAAGGEGQQIVRNIFPMTATKLNVTGQDGARLVENVKTPLGRRIRIAAKAKNVPLIESEITIYDNIKRIDIKNHIRKEDIREKEAIYFAFPFSVSKPQLQYQVHNGWARPNEDELPGACREWFTTQNVALSRDGASGLTIAFATPDVPLISFTDINRGQWLTNLDIKNGYIYSYLTNNYWSTNIKASQEGDITFRYFITSRKDLDYDAIARFDAETRSPLVQYPLFQRSGGTNVGSRSTETGRQPMPANEGSLFRIEAANAQLTTFKKAEDGDGYIVRLRETSGRDGTARLTSPIARVTRAYATNGVEENASALEVKDGAVNIPLKAWRFSTVRLSFAGTASAARNLATPATHPVRKASQAAPSESVRKP